MFYKIVLYRLKNGLIMSNFGVGLITCNRPDFFKNCYDSMKDYVENLVIVNDGNPFEKDVRDNHHFIQNEQNQGVGKSKNIALRYLLDKKLDYYFLVEDDMIIKRPEVFSKYIELYKLTNIHHFNYGFHGPANRDVSYKPCPRLVINMGDKFKLVLNKHCVGAFSFYTKHALDVSGLMNPEYHNAFEHISSTFNMIKNKLHPPFWWFADLFQSWDYIHEQASSENNSAIRFRDDWRSNIQKGVEVFIKEHNVHPLKIPDFTQQEVINIVKMFVKGDFSK